MIEYTDKVFGKIKVLNVTEARANFANVLGDSDSHYIITKNNKPLRVIINHAEYETLRRVGEAAGREGLSTEEGSPVDHLVEAFTREAAKDAVLMEKAQESTRVAPATKTFENPVKGILETNTALAKTEKPKLHKRVHPPKPLAESPLLTEPAAHSHKEPESASHQTLLASQGLFEREEENEDYFYSTDGDSSDVMDVLVEPEDFIESEISEPRPQSKTNEVVAAEVSSSAGEQKTKEIKDQDLAPEQSEYFQKYKKLYESPSLGSGNEEDDKEFEKRLQQKYANLYAEETKGQHLTQESEDPVNLDMQPEPVVTRPEVKSLRETRKTDVPNQPRAAQKEIPEIQAEEESPQNYFTDTDEEESTGLPSLKELLKDLEEEKLSGEEVSESGLNERDIDDLIERITQD